MRSAVLSAALLLALLWEMRCDPSSGDGDVSDSIPLLASGKRQHNIMRFGKRPASGHSLIHFGKRDAKGHSFLYFGKRGERDASLWDYLGTNAEPSYKRGHAIMRFGKRGPDSERRSGHSMLYFGKRGDGDRRAHAMIHFGKRGLDDESEDYWDPETVEAKRQHNLLRFGKKDRKGSHAMIHFGKRDIDEDKRAHAMIHFGKRSVSHSLQENRPNEGPSRVKREAGHPQELTLFRYEDPEEDAISSEENMRVPGLYGPETWSPLDEGEWNPSYAESRREGLRSG